MGLRVILQVNDPKLQGWELRMRTVENGKWRGRQWMLVVAPQLMQWWWDVVPPKSLPLLNSAQEEKPMKELLSDLLHIPLQLQGADSTAQIILQDRDVAGRAESCPFSCSAWDLLLAVPGQLNSSHWLSIMGNQVLAISSQHRTPLWAVLTSELPVGLTETFSEL